MKTVIYIIIILILLGALTYFSIRLYKKSLVDKILYNCKSNCDAQRKFLMSRPIKELKQMILQLENLALNLSTTTFKK